MPAHPLKMSYLRRALPALSALALAFVCFASCGRASPVHFKTIYSFCDQANCKDGKWPAEGSLLVGPDGALYGTTPHSSVAYGDKHDRGVFFKLEGRKGGSWHETSRFSFCKSDTDMCAGGFEPAGGVVMDIAGNVYGLARSGGTLSRGVAYELSPPLPGSKTWSEKVLYNFCAEAGCADGAFPVGGLTYAGAQTGVPYDGVSPLYGITTSDYGLHGVLFSLTPQALPQGAWTEEVQYTFCAQPGCIDGNVPLGNLLVEGDGTIYGVTQSGGTNGYYGTIYRFRNKTQSVLYSFCSAKNCTDGQYPVGGLVMDAQGNLFGMTQVGGKKGLGTIYELSFPGGQPEYTVLHSFCSKADCKDGTEPYPQLALDSAGRLYGTTSLGGALLQGTAFMLDGATLSLLHNFCTEPDCADGYQAVGGQVFDHAGHLFGTTQGGGAHGAGTVYELTPSNSKPRGR